MSSRHEAQRPHQIGIGIDVGFFSTRGNITATTQVLARPYHSKAANLGFECKLTTLEDLHLVVMVIGTYKMTLPSNRHSVQFTGAGRPSQALSKTNSGYSGTAE